MIKLSRCIFIFDDICTALTVKKCEGCKFKKSEGEWLAGQDRTKQRLEKMGLEAVIIGKGHDAIVTTQKIEVKDNAER